jgi:hypothetical protein
MGVRRELRPRQIGSSALSGGRSHHDAGEVVETGEIGSDDCSGGRQRRGGDDQIMRAPGPAGAPHGGEQCGVSPRDIEVIRNDREHLEQVLDERLPIQLSPARCELDSDTELCCSDRCDRWLVRVGDQSIEIELATLDGDQHARVEQERGQNRSSVTSCDRSSATSSLQAESMRCRLRTSFARAPVATRAGSS